jgi:hypothetical protein
MLVDLLAEAFGIGMLAPLPPKSAAREPSAAKPRKRRKRREQGS